MLSLKVSQRLYFLALFLTAFVIPFPFIFSPVAIMLLSVAWLLNFNLQRTVFYLKDRKTIWLWIFFYLLHAISYYYSIDKVSSLNDLETKLSFVVLPIIVGAGLPIDKTNIEKVFNAFLFGLFLMAIFFLTRAIYTYSYTSDLKVFFYHNLIRNIGANAVYYSLYTFLGLSVLLLFPWHITFLAKKSAFYVALIVLLIFFVLLSSKSMLLLFCILVLPVYLRRILKTKKIFGYLYILLGILIVSFIFFTKNPINKRYHDILENTDRTEWLPEYSNGQKQHFNNLTLRLFLWKTALQNVQGHNLWWKGCGNGSIETLQKEKISEYGTKNELLNADPPLWTYNIHNMYLQELMMLGLPGLLIFLWILVAPFFLIKFIKNKTIFVLFNVSIIFFMFQESALQTQAGVVFYIFFYMVFYNYGYIERNETTKSIASLY